MLGREAEQVLQHLGIRLFTGIVALHDPQQQDRISGGNAPEQGGKRREHLGTNRLVPGVDLRDEQNAGLMASDLLESVRQHGLRRVGGIAKERRQVQRADEEVVELVHDGAGEVLLTHSANAFDEQSRTEHAGALHRTHQLFLLKVDWVVGIVVFGLPPGRSGAPSSAERRCPGGL